MELWVPIILAISGGVLIAACVATVRTRHLRERAAGELQAVLSVALEEATRRRHATVGAHHLARALLAIPAIPSTLQPGGVSVDALRSALDAALDAIGAATTDVAPASSAEVTQLLRDVTRTQPSADVALLLGAFLHALCAAEASTRELFASQGATWQTPPRIEMSWSDQHVPPGAAFVVAWDDDRSPLHDVIEIFQQALSVPVTEATYLAMRVHWAGRAVAQCCGPDEADALAARTISIARARGAPLRVTVERS